MAEREAAVSFAAMIIAADRYLNAGLPLSKLDPWEAQRRKMIELPAEAASDSQDSRWWRNLWLGAWGDSLVGVGVVGDYKDVRSLVDQYGRDSSAVYFPYPEKLTDRITDGTGQLLMIFTPGGLHRAAARAELTKTCCQ